MKLSLFDYRLPRHLIAQKPIRPRGFSRLMVIDRKRRKIEYDYFVNLANYLKSGDVLVFNDSRVFPARLWAKKETGGKLEVLLLRERGNYWEVLLGGKVRREKMAFKIGRSLEGKIILKLEDGVWLLQFNLKGKKLWKEIKKHGEAPTPPYIKMKSNLADYQTIFAKKNGSVAAPTAGFHFTKKLFKTLKKAGVRLEFITLHVGYGTFQPVKEENIEEHKMHHEFYEVKREIAQRLIKAKKEGRRIIAVGTTTARVLEGIVSKYRKTPKRNLVGKTDLFIYPGYKFTFVDSLITNFHLPKSTLLMLVSAFVGKAFIKRAYQSAVKKGYQFYSFGDGMLIL